MADFDHQRRKEQQQNRPETNLAASFIIASSVRLTESGAFATAWTQLS